jgi:hypothetical protein
MGKKGMGILKEVMDEHIKQFRWLNITMASHYIKTYPKEDVLPTVIGTHHQTVMPGINDSLPTIHKTLQVEEVAR